MESLPFVVALGLGRRATSCGQRLGRSPGIWHSAVPIPFPPVSRLEHRPWWSQRRSTFPHRSGLTWDSSGSDCIAVAGKRAPRIGVERAPSGFLPQHDTRHFHRLPWAGMFVGMVASQCNDAPKLDRPDLEIQLGAGRYVVTGAGKVVLAQPYRLDSIHTLLVESREGERLPLCRHVRDGRTPAVALSRNYAPRFAPCGTLPPHRSKPEPAR